MSRKVAYKELGLLALGFILIWFAIDRLNIFPEEVEVGLTPEQEKTLGELIVNSMVNGNEIEDSLTVATVEVILTRLVDEIPEKNLEDYTYIIVDNDDVNAFATLGDHIVIYKGLLTFADSAEEVAGVLAHEIGHLEEDHVRKQLIREFGIGYVISALTGNQSAVVDLTRTIIRSKFSRKHETEADDFGHDLMEKSQINPVALAAFFERIEAEYGDVPEKLAFLSTHPSHSSRIERTNNYEVDQNFEAIRLPIEWDNFVEQLDIY